MLGSAAVARRAASGSISGGLKIGLPCFDRDLECRIGALAPQFAAVEQHGIKPLRILALADRYAVGEDVATAHAFDHPDMAARVARQAGVCLRMNVLSAHPVTDIEARDGAGRPA